MKKNVYVFYLMNSHYVIEYATVFVYLAQIPI